MGRPDLSNLSGFDTSSPVVFGHVSSEPPSSLSEAIIGATYSGNFGNTATGWEIAWIDLGGEG